MSTTDPTDSAIKRSFPRLSQGRHGIPAEEVAANQRGRLEAALIDAVASEGFASTTLNRLVADAGVSKTTFYQLFGSKQACFLAAFDTIVDSWVASLEAALQKSTGGSRSSGALGLAIEETMRLVSRDPAAASLVFVDSLTLGSAGIDHRRKGIEALDRAVMRAIKAADGNDLSERTIRVALAGVRGVIFRRLRAGDADDLPGLVDELLAWVDAYPPQPSAPVAAAMRAAGRRLELHPRPPYGLPWEESPASAASRRQLSQYDRIARAATLVVLDRGYESLSIPTISAAAGTSYQTFYEHFDSKRDAFLAGFRMRIDELGRRTRVAMEPEGDRPEAIGVAIRALLTLIATDEGMARLAFVDLVSAGPVGLDYLSYLLDGFASYLEPDLAPPALARPLPPMTLWAITAAAWETIQAEIVAGRLGSLPRLAPEITRIATAPLAPGG